MAKITVFDTRFSNAYDVNIEKGSVKVMGLGTVFMWKGEFVSQEKIDIDLFDRGYQYGDGIYEVIHVYNGKLFTKKEHIDRLFSSAEKIQLNLKMTRTEIDGLCERLVEKNKIEHGYIYIQVSRGDSILRTHGFPLYEDQNPVYSGFAVSSIRNIDKILKPSNAITFDDLRGNLCDVKSLNLIPNALAMHEAQKLGARKAILVKDGIVTEEKSGNLLMVKNGEVFTHPDGPRILPGITKMVIKEQCRNNDIIYVEKEFTIKDLFEADEVLVVDTNSECVGVNEIDGKLIGDGKRGPMTDRIQKLYEKAIILECGSL